MSFKVCICWPGKVADWLPPWLQAVKEGLHRHGVNVIETDYANPKPCDLAVFWSVRPTHIIQKQVENNADYLVLEMGYVGDRREWTSCGFNGLNNRADFHAKNMPPDRWIKNFQGYLKPWAPAGKYALLIGQVLGDMSVKDIDLWGWYDKKVSEIKEQYPGMPIKFRQHPVEKERNPREVKGTYYSTDTLKQDLKNAAMVVTFSSNTGVDAILAGKLTFSDDPGSMVWPITSHDITRPEWWRREQWAYDLAYKQWRLDEISAGEMWAHLGRRYE